MIVWNISHLSGSKPINLVISGEPCSPGGHVVVDSITEKERNLVGTYLYVGNKLPEFAPVKKDPLSKEECEQYLDGLSIEKLRILGAQVSPGIQNLEDRSKHMLIGKLISAIFNENKSVNPKYFLWTNMWRAEGSGYIEV